MKKDDMTPASQGLSAAAACKWLLIETAPRDGTVVLIANAEMFAAGYLAFRVEMDWKYLGYDEGVRSPDGGLMIGPRFAERVPNPEAGKRTEWWYSIGCSAFSDDTCITDDEGWSKFVEPTHWMPMPAPPKI